MARKLTTKCSAGLEMPHVHQACLQLGQSRPSLYEGLRWALNSSRGVAASRCTGTRVYEQVHVLALLADQQQQLAPCEPQLETHPVQGTVAKLLGHICLTGKRQVCHHHQEHLRCGTLLSVLPSSCAAKRLCAACQAP